MNGMHISGLRGSWKGPGCYAQSWNYTLWGTVTPEGLQQGDGAARQDHPGQKRGWMGGGEIILVINSQCNIYSLSLYQEEISEICINELENGWG